MCFSDDMIEDIFKNARWLRFHTLDTLNHPQPYIVSLCSVRRFRNKFGRRFSSVFQWITSIILIVALESLIHQENLRTPRILQFRAKKNYPDVLHKMIVRRNGASQPTLPRNSTEAKKAKENARQIAQQNTWPHDVIILNIFFLITPCAVTSASILPKQG